MKLRVIIGIVLTLFLVGVLTATFNVPPVKGAIGTIYIRSDGSVDPPTANITSVDNVTYTLIDNIYSSISSWLESAIVVERDDIVVDGAGYTLQGTEVPYSIGIDLSDRSNVTIRNMKIKAFHYGIWFNMSLGNNIYGNNITANEHGIFVGWASNYNSISGNNITANNGVGVWLYWSSNYNTISGNNIKNNFHGILLGSSSNNIISGNDITANNWVGIELESSSNYNIISGNAVTENNWNGIRFECSSNNKFYHNNFIGTHVHSENSTNTWDDSYPSGGNYWSDYNGTDSNRNGIGDIPYTIDENNTDNYPLMGMFSDFPVTLEEKIHHVTTICNSTISAFQFNQSANLIRFNVTGKDGTSGFCRIRIPTALMNDTFTVLVNGTEIPYTLLPCSNATYNYLYLTYDHSTQEVIIIPEFPTALILTLLIIVTLVATAMKKKARYHTHT